MTPSPVCLGHLSLPLFTLDDERGCGFLGTSFLAAPGVLATCWHCVEGPVRAGAKIGVVGVQSAGAPFFVLQDVAQDPSGADLATAAIPRTLSPIGPTARLGNPIMAPTDVCTWGYPLTRFERRSAQGPGTYHLEPRYLQGYVTRYFVYDHGRFGRARSYELDMPAPDGLSGAPLIVRGSDVILGVIYGTIDVARTEEVSAVDPDTGARTPQLDRIVSFGLAHHTLPLAELRGPATGGRPLADLMPTS